MATDDEGSGTDKSHVSNAQKREAIRGYLSGTPGEHPVAEVAASTGMSRGATGQLLMHMAKNKLVKVRKEGTAKLYSWPQNGVVTVEPGGNGRKTRKMKGTVATTTPVPPIQQVQDVELVIRIQMRILVEQK